MKILKTFLLMALLILTSCHDEYDATSYNKAYDSLFTQYIDITQLSKKMNVPASNLVRTRYGIMECNTELVDFLSELNQAYIKFDHKKVNKLLDKASDKEYKFNKIDGIDFNKIKSNYKEIAYARNEEFDNQLPQLAGATISNNLQKYIDKEFAWYRFPVNGWNYLWEGKDKMQSKYHEKFYDIIEADKSDKYIVGRFNSYSNLLTIESKVLFDKQLNIPTLKRVTLTENDSSITKDLENKTVDRISLDLLDSILLVIEELGFGLLIWFVSQWVIRTIYKKYEKQKIGYVAGAGWWNIAFFVTDLFTDWEREEELRTARAVTRWIKGIITVGFLIVGYIYVIKPQMLKEDEIINTINNNISTYVQGIDLPILSFFNNILGQI